MGAKCIAAYLNSKGITQRGHRWTRGRVHAVLSNDTYTGIYRFSRVDARNRRRKPEAEWVTVAVEVMSTKARSHARRRAGAAGRRRKCRRAS